MRLWPARNRGLRERDDEVVLGPRTIHDLDVSVGDPVSFVAHHTSIPMRVVGVALVPDTTDRTLGRDALSTQGGMRRAAGATCFSSLLIRAVDPAVAASLHGELVQRYELNESDPPRLSARSTSWAHRPGCCCSCSCSPPCS